MSSRAFPATSGGAAAVDNRFGAYRSGKFTMVTFQFADSDGASHSFSERYGGARPFPTNTTITVLSRPGARFCAAFPHQDGAMIPKTIK